MLGPVRISSMIPGPPKFRLVPRNVLVDVSCQLGRNWKMVRVLSIPYPVHAWAAATTSAWVYWSTPRVKSSISSRAKFSFRDHFLLV